MSMMTIVQVSLHQSIISNYLIDKRTMISIKTIKIFNNHYNNSKLLKTNSIKLIKWGLNKLKCIPNFNLITLKDK